MGEMGSKGSRETGPGGPRLSVTWTGEFGRCVNGAPMLYTLPTPSSRTPGMRHMPSLTATFDLGKKQLPFTKSQARAARSGSSCGHGAGPPPQAHSTGDRTGASCSRRALTSARGPWGGASPKNVERRYRMFLAVDWEGGALLSGTGMSDRPSLRASDQGEPQRHVQRQEGGVGSEATLC